MYTSFLEGLSFKITSFVIMLLIIPPQFGKQTHAIPDYLVSIEKMMNSSNIY